MGKYLLENIRVAFPDARFALAVSSRIAMIRDLFAAYPWLEIVEANKRPGSLSSLFGRGQQDVVITPYTGGVFPLAPKIAARLIARTLVGYTDSSRLNRFLYTKLIPLVGRARAPRLLETDALRALDIPAAIERPTFAYVPQPHLLERLGLSDGKYVVLHLFSGADARGLSPENRRTLIHSLSEALPRDVAVVLTGSDAERESLGKEFPSNVVLASTSLQELAELINHSALMVSLDTGAAHIAAHLRKPLVVLASCVGMQWWSPEMYGAGVPSALFTRPDICKGRHDYSSFAKCLEAVDLREVAQTAARLLHN